MPGRRRRRQRQDRTGLRDWLEDHLVNGHFEKQLQWTDKSRKKFCLRWTHRSRATYDEDMDSVIFREWAIHTGKNQVHDPSRWKTNFRCALNSIKDIRPVGHGHTCKYHSEKTCREFYFVDNHFKVSVKKQTNKKKNDQNSANLVLIENTALSEQEVSAAVETIPNTIHPDFPNEENLFHIDEEMPNSYTLYGGAYPWSLDEISLEDTTKEDYSMEPLPNIDFLSFPLTAY